MLVLWLKVIYEQWTLCNLFHEVNAVLSFKHFGPTIIPPANGHVSYKCICWGITSLDGWFYCAALWAEILIKRYPKRYKYLKWRKARCKHSLDVSPSGNWETTDSILLENEGSKKKGKLIRLELLVCLTRWGVALIKQPVLCSKASPKLTTNEPSTGGASIHEPSACFTCKPPLLSCSNRVK